MTVLTSPEPKTQWMALVLTAQAVGAGTGADLLLCGPGADIARAEPPPAAIQPQPPRGQSPQGLLAALIEAGATARVCAIHLPGKGLGQEARMQGVTVAAPAAMAAAMLAEHTRVWSR